jgi:hypothetical protein
MKHEGPGARASGASAIEHGAHTPDIPPESFQAMLHAWASLHGFTSLEAYGHLDWMGAGAVEDLFLGQVRLAARAAGIPFE